MAARATPTAGTAQIVFEGDFSKLERQLATRMRNRTVKANVEADSSDLRGLNRELDSTVSRARGADRSLSSLGGTIARSNRNFTFLRNTIRVIKWPALIAGAGAATQGISALTAATTGLIGALGPLSGFAVTVPAALGTIGQSAATAAFALTGLGDAVGALNDVQTKAGATATDLARTQRTAAEAIRSAEMALADAQRGVRFAQEDLNEARGEAIDQLRELKFLAADAATTEKQAVLELQKARRALRETREDPDAGMFDLRQALLDVEAAENGVRAARDARKRSQEELDQAEKRGLTRAENVVDAQRALADAQRAASEAARDVRIAQQDANEALSKGSSAADDLQEKMSALPPAGRNFARFLFSLKPRLDDLRATAADGLLPGLEEGIRSALKNFPALNRVVDKTAKAMGDAAAESGEFLGRKGFGKDFEVIGARNAETIGDMGEAGLNLADALRHVLVAADPFLDWIGESVVKFTEMVKGEAKAGRESGKLAEFFDKARAVGERLASILGSVGSAIFDIASAGAPLGNDILKSLDEGAQHLERWADSTKGQQSLRRYFENAKPVVFEIGRLTRDIFQTLLDVGGTPGLEGLIHKFRTGLLPAIEEVVTRLTSAAESGNFGRELADMVGDAIPAVAEAAAAGAGRIAVAFAEGFTQADIWGRLALGGALISKLGLGGAIFKSAGTKAASEAAEGLVTTGAGEAFATAGGSAAGKFGAGWKGALLRGGLILGGITAVMEIANRLANPMGEKFAEAWAAAADPQLEKAIERRNVPALERLEEQASDTAEAIRELDFTGADEAADKIEDFADRSRDALRRLGEKIAKAKVDIRDLKLGYFDNLDEILDKTRTNSQKIADELGRGSKKGKELLDKNYSAAVAAIEHWMQDKGPKAVERGNELIEDILKKQLALMGIKGAHANAIIYREQHGGEGPLGPVRQRGGFVEYAGGGLMRVPGTGLRDTVPLAAGQIKAMVAPGEELAVLNRHQRPVLDAIVSATLGVNGLGGFFKKFNRPHAMAQGGLVQALGPYDIPPIQADANHGAAGFNSHLHISMASVAAAKAIAAKMRKLGWAISETPWAGGVTVNHQDPGHYTGSAFDANTASDETRAEVAAVARLLGGVGGPGLAKLKLPRFGSDIPAFGAAAAGLNRISSGLERVFGRRLGRDNGVQGMLGSVSGGTGSDVMQAISRRRGWSFDDWWKLDGEETSHGADMVNESSTARMRGQFLDFNWGKYGPGSDPRPDINNPASWAPMSQQIASMGAYIGERYGNPTAAWAWHQGHNWYDRGGFVDLWGKGIAHFARGGNPHVGPASGGTGEGWRRPEKLLRKIREQAEKTGVWDERILVAETLAGFPGSELGTDIGAGERSNLIGLNTSLLENLTKRRDLVKLALSQIPKRHGQDLATKLRGQLVDLEGITGKGGRLLTVSARLADLGAPSEAEDGRLQMLADLRGQRITELERLLAVRNVQSPIIDQFFNRFAGAFANGGNIPSGMFGVVGERGPEFVSGPASVTPGVQVTVVVEDGAVDANKIRTVVTDSLGGIVRNAKTGPAVGRKAVY